MCSHCSKFEQPKTMELFFIPSGFLQNLLIPAENSKTPVCEVRLWARKKVLGFPLIGQYEPLSRRIFFFFFTCCNNYTFLPCGTILRKMAKPKGQFIEEKLYRMLLNVCFGHLFVKKRKITKFAIDKISILFTSLFKAIEWKFYL